MVYGQRQGHSWGALFRMAISGVAIVRNIAVVMLLVGAMTALWRASGTIAFIVSAASDVLKPELFLPAAFILNSIISVLTGTSVGTAATMGVICMSVGNTLGIDPMISGGAVLAGAYFGDRCSPVSTSALLVAEVTHTNIYYNIKAMVSTSIFPLVISLGIYTWLGYNINHTPAPEMTMDVKGLFNTHYSLSWITTLPAITMLLLAFFKVNVKYTMAISIAASALICHYQQGMELSDILNIAFLGFDAPAEIAKMMSGGGVLAMLKLIGVVILSLTYAGLFKGLELLKKLEQAALYISKKVSPFGSVVMMAIATCALSCNQTLSIILTNEVCRNVIPDNYRRAIYLENSSVIIAPLVPWTVASLIPLGAMGAPTGAILFACYLYLIPAVNLFRKKIPGFYNG